MTHVLPESIDALIAELAAESASAGWDGERGVPVGQSTWEDARAILRHLTDRFLQSPALHISMSGDGFVHLTVTQPGRGSATVEVGHGRFYWTWTRGMDQAETAELSNLLNAASKLAEFAEE